MSSRKWNNVSNRPRWPVWPVCTIIPFPVWNSASPPGRCDPECNQRMILRNVSPLVGRHRSHHRAKRQAPVGCLTIALPLVDLPPPPPVLPLLSLPAPSLPLPVLPILPVLPVLGLLPILITTTTTTTTTTTPCVDASTTGNCALLPSLPVALATALCSGGLGTTLCQKTCDDVVGGYCWGRVPFEWASICPT